MEDEGGGAGVAGNVVVDFLEILGGVAVGPEEELEGAFAVAGFPGLEFLDVGTGEAAAAGAVVDLDGDLEADHEAGLEDAGVAGGEVAFRPEHDLAGAGEVLDGEDAEGFPGLGAAGLDAADHAGDGVALLGVVELDLVDEADAVVFVGVEDAAEFVERVAGDVEAEEFLLVGEAVVLGPFFEGVGDGRFVRGGGRGEVHGIEEGGLA